MQDNIITLPVDVTNTDTLVNLVLSRQEEYLNRTVYIAPGHMPDSRDMFGLYRSPIKPTSAFKGVMRTSFKFTKDVLVLNPVGEQISSPMIAEVSFSIPVGTSAAEKLEMTQRVGAMACFRDVMSGLIDQQSI